MIRGRLGDARYAWPLVQDTYQEHAVELLDALSTVDGEVLPVGTQASVLSSGNRRGARGDRLGCTLSLWGSGRQVDVYTE